VFVFERKSESIDNTTEYFQQFSHSIVSLCFVYEPVMRETG